MTRFCGVTIGPRFKSFNYPLSVSDVKFKSSFNHVFIVCSNRQIWDFKISWTVQNFTWQAKMYCLLIL